MRRVTPYTRRMYREMVTESVIFFEILVRAEANGIVCIGSFTGMRILNSSLIAQNGGKVLPVVETFGFLPVRRRDWTSHPHLVPIKLRC